MEKQVILNLRQSTQRIGGAEVVIRRTVAGIDKSQFEVIIVCLKKPGMDLSAIQESLKDTGSTYLELESKALFDLKSLIAIWKLIGKYRPHIIHCHDPKTDFIGFILRFLPTGARLITTLHGWVIASHKGAWYKRLDQFFARFFHAAVAVSPLIEEEARQKGIKRVHLIENGIPISYWRSLAQANLQPPVPKGDGEKWVGFLGRITREKGPIEFIETAALIANKTETARFIVAGEGPLLDDMKKLAQARGIAQKCTFLGQVPLEGIPSFLANLDVLLSTSETEGIPNSLLEAGALGIPIVATAVGGVPRVVVHGEGGFLAPFRAHEALANHTVELLSDPQRHQSCSKYLKAWIEQNFSIEVTTQKLVSLYDKLSKPQVEGK